MEDINKDPMNPQNGGEQNPTPKISSSSTAVRARAALAKNKKARDAAAIAPDLWGGHSGQQGGLGINYNVYAGGAYAKAAKRGDWSKSVTPNFNAAVKAFEENTFWDLTGDALSGFAKNIAAGAIEQLGAYDIADMTAMAMNDKVNLTGNFMQRLAAEIKDNVAKEHQIYTKDTGSLGGDMMNGTYWASQVQNMGYTVGIMLPTIAEQALLSAVTAGTGGTAGVVQAGRLANNLAKFRTIGQVGLGVSSGVREAYVNARETMENVYHEYMAKVEKGEYTKEQAEEIARRAGHLAFKTEILPITVLNTLQNLALFGGMSKAWKKSDPIPGAQVFNRSNGFKGLSLGVSDAAGSLIEKVFPHIENKWARRAFKYGVVGGGSESIEEGYQTFAGNYGAYLAEKDVNPNAEFSLDAKEMRDSMVGGFLGGILLGAGGKAVQKYFTGKEESNFHRNYETYLENTVEKSSKALNNMLTLQQKVQTKKAAINTMLENAGSVDHRNIPKDIKTAIEELGVLNNELAQATISINTMHAASALQMDYMKGDGSMAAYNAHMESLQDIVEAIDTKDVQKLQAFKLLDENGKEVTPGALEDFKESVQESIDISQKYKENIETTLDQVTNDFNIAHNIAYRETMINVAQEEIDKRSEASEKLYETNNRFNKLTKKGQLKFKQQVEFQALNNVPDAKKTPEQRERLAELTKILAEQDPEFSKKDEQQLRMMSKGREATAMVNAFTDIETRKAELQDSMDLLEESKTAEGVKKQFTENLLNDLENVKEKRHLKQIVKEAKNNSVYTSEFEAAVNKKMNSFMAVEELAKEEKKKSEEAKKAEKEKAKTEKKNKDKKKPDQGKKVKEEVKENSEKSKTANAALDTLNESQKDSNLSAEESDGGETETQINLEGFEDKSKTEIIQFLVDNGVNPKMAEQIAETYLDRIEKQKAQTKGSESKGNSKTRQGAKKPLDLNNIPVAKVETSGNGKYHLKHKGKILAVYPKDASLNTFTTTKPSNVKQKTKSKKKEEQKGYYEGWEDTLDILDQDTFSDLVLNGVSKEDAYNQIMGTSSEEKYAETPASENNPFGDFEQGEEAFFAPKAFNEESLDNNKERITKAFESVIQELENELGREAEFFDFVAKMIRNTTLEDADAKYLMFAKIWQDYLGKGKLTTEMLDDTYGRLFNPTAYASSLLDSFILDEEVGTATEEKSPNITAVKQIDNRTPINKNANEVDVENNTGTRDVDFENKSLAELEEGLEQGFILDEYGNFVPAIIERDTRRTETNPVLAYTVSPYVEHTDNEGVTRKLNASTELQENSSLDSSFSPLSMVEMQPGDTLGFEIDTNPNAIVSVYVTVEDESGFTKDVKLKMPFGEYVTKYGIATLNSDGSIKEILNEDEYIKKVPIKVRTSAGTVGYIQDQQYFNESTIKGDPSVAYNNNLALRQGIFNGDFDSLEIESKRFGSVFLLSKTAGVEYNDVLRPISENTQGYTNQTMLAVGMNSQDNGHSVILADHLKINGSILSNKEQSGIHLVNSEDSYELGAIYDLRKVGTHTDGTPMYFASKAYSNNPSRGEFLDPRVANNIKSVFVAAYINANKNSTETVGRDNPKVIRSILASKHVPKDSEGKSTGLDMFKRAQEIQEAILQSEGIDINTVVGLRQYLSKYLNLYTGINIQSQADVAATIESFLENDSVPNGTPILVMDSTKKNIHYAIKGAENNGGFLTRSEGQDVVNYKYFPSPTVAFNSKSFKPFGDFMEAMFEGENPAINMMMFSPSPNTFNSEESRENPITLISNDFEIVQNHSTTYDTLTKEILRNDVKSFEIETQAGVEIVTDVQPMITLKGKNSSADQIGLREAERLGENKPAPKTVAPKIQKDSKAKTKKKGEKVDVNEVEIKDPKVAKEVKEAQEKGQKVSVTVKDEKVEKGEVKSKVEVKNETTGKSIEENATVIRNNLEKESNAEIAKTVNTFVSKLETTNPTLRNIILGSDFDSILGESLDLDDDGGFYNAPALFTADQLDKFSNIYTNKISALSPEEQSQFADFLFNETINTLSTSNKKVNLKEVVYQIRKSVDANIDTKIAAYTPVQQQIAEYLEQNPNDKGAIIYKMKLDNRVKRLEQIKVEKDKLISDGRDGKLKGKVFLKFERLFNEKLADIELSQTDIETFDALMNENNIEDIDSGSIDDSWSSSAYERNVKISFSKEMKLFFTGVQKYTADGKPLYNSLGFPVYYSMEDVLTTVQEITTSVPSDLEMVMNLLHKKAFEEVQGKQITNSFLHEQIYEKMALVLGQRTNNNSKTHTDQELEKAKNPKLVNELLYKLIQNRLSMDMIIYAANENSGTYALRKINANSRDALDSLYRQWKTNFRNSKFVTTEAGEVVYNVDAVLGFLNKYDNFVSNVKKKSITGQQAKEEFINMLNEIGIMLSPGAINSMLGYNDKYFLTKVSTQLSAKSVLGGFAANLRGLTKTSLSHADIVIDSDAKLPHKSNIRSVLMKMASDEKNAQGANISRSFRVDGKNIQGTIQDMMAYRELEKLKGESTESFEHRKFMKELALTSNNQLLDMLTKNPTVRARLGISHVSLRAIKNAAKKTLNDNGKFANLPLTDAILAELGFFTSISYNIDEQVAFSIDKEMGPTNRVRLRMSDLMFPTLSDKDAMIKLTTVVMDLKANRVDNLTKKDKEDTSNKRPTEGNLFYDRKNLHKNFEIHDKVMSLLSESFFKSELRRIISYRIKEGNINIKASETAGTVFISMPYLNKMAFKSAEGPTVHILDYIDGLISAEENPNVTKIASMVIDKFDAKAKDIIANTIHQDVKAKIDIRKTKSVKTEDGKTKSIYDFSGEWYENGFLEYDEKADRKENKVSIKHLDTDYLNSKIVLNSDEVITQEDVIAKAKMAAYDFVINNLVNQNNIYQLISGDIALYAKSDFNKFTDKFMKNSNATYLDTAKNQKVEYGTQLKALNKALDNASDPKKVEALKLAIKELRKKFMRSPHGTQLFIDYSIEVGENATKRNAMNIAPGNLLANSYGEKYLQVIVNDPVSHSNVSKEIIRAAYPNMTEEQQKVFENEVPELGEASRQLAEKLEKSYSSESKVLAEDISNLQNKIENLREVLGSTFPKVGGYFEMEGADAQEYTTWEEFIDIIFRQGRMSDVQVAEMVEIQNTLAEGKDLSQEQIEKLITLNPQKPVYAGKTKMYLDGEAFTDRTFYVKTSAFPLLPQLTRDFPEMDALRRNMEKLTTMDIDGSGEVDYRGVRLSFQSGNKIGSVAKAVDITSLYDPNADLKTLLGFNNKGNDPKSALILDRSNFRIQQDTPSKTDKFLSMFKDDEVTMGSQFWKIAMGGSVNMEKERIFKNTYSAETLEEARQALKDEIRDLNEDGLSGRVKNKQGEDIDLVFEEGKPLNGAELDFLKFLAERKLFEHNKKKLANDLGLNPRTYLPYNIEETTKKLQAILVDEVTVRDYPINILDELGLKLTSKGNQEFNIPLWMSNSTDKFEALLNSVVTNRLIKLKLPGNQHISTSSQGFSRAKMVTMDDLDNKTKSRVVHLDPLRPTGPLRGTYVEEVMDENGEIQKITHPSEVLIKSHFRYEVTKPDGTKEMKLVDLNNDKYYFMQDGMKFLNMEMIDPELLEFFTFRIPTSAHQSGALVKVIGFLPPESGDMIVVPAEHTQQIGEDYDIDKRFVYKYHYFLDQDGGIRKLSPEALTKIKEETDYVNRPYLENDFTMLVNSIMSDSNIENYTAMNNYIRHRVEYGAIESLIKKYKSEGSTRFEMIRELQEQLEELTVKIENNEIDILGNLHESSIEKYYSHTGSFENDRIRDIRESLLSLIERKTISRIEKKVLENDIINSYISLFSANDFGMQSKINEILSFDIASVSANLVDRTIKAREEELKTEGNTRESITTEKGFSIFSDNFQRAQRILGADGKIGIGAHSNAVTMQALMERVREKIHTTFTIEDEEGNVTRHNSTLTIGDMTSSGELGLTNTINSIDVAREVQRTVAAVHAENQNSATDNVKAQIMGKRNENKYTISVLSQLTYRGFDQTVVKVGGKSINVHMPTLFLAQPVLREYTKLKEQANSLTADTFVSDEQIYLMLFKQFIDESSFNKLADALGLFDLSIENSQDVSMLFGSLKEAINLGQLSNAGTMLSRQLTGNTLYEQLSSTVDPIVQAVVLAQFGMLKNEATSLGKVQSMLNVSTSGMGISYFETLRRIEDLVDFGFSEKFTNLHGIVGDFYTSNENSINDFISLPTEIKTQYVKFSSPKDPSKFIYVKPKTSEGVMLVNSLKTTMGSVGLVYPYQSPLIKGTVNDIIDIVQNGDTEISKTRQVKISYKVANFIRDYLYSGETLGLFRGSPNEERNRLFMDDADTGKMSLPAYMQMLSQNLEHPLFRNNLLLRDFDYTEVNKKQKGYPSILKFLDNSSDSFDKSDRYTAFLELIADNKTQLPMFNGEIMTPLKLARDLASYAYLGNQEGGAIGFRSFVHQDYLETIGFSGKLREINEEMKKGEFNTLFNTTGTSLTDVKRSIITQYMQHNPEDFNKLMNAMQGSTDFVLSEIYALYGDENFTPVEGISREAYIAKLNNFIKHKPGSKERSMAFKEVMDSTSIIDVKSIENILNKESSANSQLIKEYLLGIANKENVLIPYKLIDKKNSKGIKPYALFRVNEHTGSLERVPTLGVKGFNETRAQAGIFANESALQPRLSANLSDLLSMRSVMSSYRLSLKNHVETEAIDLVSDMFISDEVTANDLYELVNKLVAKNQKIYDQKSQKERYLFDFNHGRLASKLTNLNNTLGNNVEVIFGDQETLKENMLSEAYEASGLPKTYNMRGSFVPAGVSATGKPFIFIDNETLKKHSEAKNKGLLTTDINPKEPIEVLVNTLLEEGIHSSLNFIVEKYAVDKKTGVEKANSPMSVQRLFMLYRLAKEHPEMQQKAMLDPSGLINYRLKNMPEFIAGIFLDEEFRNSLNEVFPDMSKIGEKSFFTKILDSIKALFADFLGINFSDATIKTIEDIIALDSAEALSKNYYKAAMEMSETTKLMPHRGWAISKPDEGFTQYGTYEISNTEDADLVLDDSLAVFSNGKSIKELMGDLTLSANDESMYPYYLKLWHLYLSQNPYKLMKIKEEAYDKILTKKDLSSNLNPVRAISNILNENTLDLNTLEAIDEKIRKELGVAPEEQYNITSTGQSKTIDSFLKNVRPVNLLDLRNSDKIDTLRMQFIVDNFFSEDIAVSERPYLIKAGKKDFLKAGERKVLSTLREMMEEKYGYSEMYYTEAEIKENRELYDRLVEEVGPNNLDRVFMINPDKDPKEIKKAKAAREAKKNPKYVGNNIDAILKKKAKATAKKQKEAEAKKKAASKKGKTASPKQEKTKTAKVEVVPTELVSGHAFEFVEDSKNADISLGSLNLQEPGIDWTSVEEVTEAADRFIESLLALDGPIIIHTDFSNLGATPETVKILGNKLYGAFGLSYVRTEDQTGFNLTGKVKNDNALPSETEQIDNVEDTTPDIEEDGTVEDTTEIDPNNPFGDFDMGEFEVYDAPNIIGNMNEDSVVKVDDSNIMSSKRLPEIKKCK